VRSAYSGLQPGVAFAQRHRQPLGQAQHHRAAGLGAAGLEPAQVARRHLGLQRQRQLRQARAQPALAQQPAERGARAVHGRAA
jgi:hypothetical protein